MNRTKRERERDAVVGNGMIWALGISGDGCKEVEGWCHHLDIYQSLILKWMIPSQLPQYSARDMCVGQYVSFVSRESIPSLKQWNYSSLFGSWWCDRPSTMTMKLPMRVLSHSVWWVSWLMPSGSVFGDDTTWKLIVEQKYASFCILLPWVGMRSINQIAWVCVHHTNPFCTEYGNK